MHPYLVATFETQGVPPNDNRQFQDRRQLAEQTTDNCALQIDLGDELEKRVIAKESIIVQVDTIK
jgi:hypothetical protein